MGRCMLEGMNGTVRRRHVLLKVRTEMVPSEDAQARMAPSSCGAHDTEFTGKR